MICKLCNNSYSRQGGSFNKHLKKEHNIDSYLEYVIITEYNGVIPLCKCGCGNQTTFHKGDFKEYCHGHNSIEFHNKNNELKPNDKIIELYKSGLSGLEVSKKLKLDRGYVYRVINENDILRTMSYAKRKYTIDDKIFEKIDTEEKAYWLGFLYADGYNHVVKSTVSLCLKSNDITTLKDFSHFLKTNKPIRKNNDTSKKVVIENKKISKDLEKWGVVQCKTHKLKFPSFLDAHLEKHFIRGYFDGDGCITYGKKLQRNATISMVSTKNFLEEIDKRIEINFSYTKRHKNRIDAIYTIGTGGICNLMKFYSYIYENSNIYMKRKKEKFEEWFEWYFKNNKCYKSTLELKNKLKIRR